MNNESKELLINNYNETCNKRNDLHPYCELLSHMAKDCRHVTEMGIGPVQYGLNSTWGLLHGLSESSFPNEEKKYVAYDLIDENTNIYDAQKLSKEIGIDFDFVVVNSIETEIDNTDLLFIDTDHRYQHLMKELQLHSGKVSKYIIIHDTSGKYENWEDYPYYHEFRGELKDSPEKYGMWPCVVDFLKDNSDWKLLHRYVENSGMTVLERVDTNNNVGW